MKNRKNDHLISKPCNQPDRNRPQDAAINCIDSHCLMSSNGQCWICHNGQHYLLRITASNRLILTK